MPTGSYGCYYPTPPQQAIPANSGSDENSASVPPPPITSQASSIIQPPVTHALTATPPSLPSPVATGAPIPITESSQPPQQPQPIAKPSNFEQFETITKDASPEMDDQESNEYNAQPTEEPASGSSEFSGLVSYFSSQQDDLDT